MADIEKTEFEFPDEIEEKKQKTDKVLASKEESKDDQNDQDDSEEIEIVDDAPAEDQNREPLTEPPEDVTEEELSKYSNQRLKARLAHIGKGYHEERRAKEAAQREREEAIRIANVVAEENKKLKGSLHQGQAALLAQAKKVVANELEQAKRKFKEAYESGDADALTAAQEEMTLVKIKAERVNNFKPSPLQETKNDVTIPTSKPEPQKLDQKTQAWTEKNTWFGPNKKMTAYALGLHEELVSEGFSAGSDEYFKRVDNEMRERFPDVFDAGKPENASSSPKKSNVVAPATRSTAPRKIVLTKSQVSIAKRLQVPLHLYARQLAATTRE